MSKHFDFIILGAGNAGMAAAKVAFEASKTVAIVESDDFGGTCPNRGCTPKKVLVATAKALDVIQKASTHGINTERTELDWSGLIQRKDEMIDFIPGAMEQVANSRADVYKGHARFIDTNTVEVNGESLSGEHIIIATGSTPRPLPFPGSDLLLTSDQLLDIKHIPESIVFIGGGVIALEFSHVFTRAGAKVTVLEALPTLLPRMDQDAVTQLQRASEDAGIQFETNVSVRSVWLSDDSDTHRRVFFTQNDEERQLSAEVIVNGAGRVPNIAHLDLQAAGVEVTNGGIAVDQDFRSVSNPRVYVIGDALSTTAQLSPLATREGGETVKRILDPEALRAKPQVVPQAIYSIPTLASVGLSGSEAAARYPALKTYTSDLSTWFSARTAVEKFAWSKVLIDEATDQIVGAHILGHQGEELIHLFTLAMNHGISASELKDTTFAFPTFSSDIKNFW